jgi:small-conductance mechanosensitive channel
MIEKWAYWITEHTGVSDERLKDFFGILVAFLVIYILRFILLRIAFHYKKGVRERYRWRKTTLHIATFLFIAVSGALLIEAFSELVTFFSFVAGALVLALRYPILGIAGWVFIMGKRPFDVGDRIQIGEHRGDVIDQRLFMFSLMEIGNWVGDEQSTGRVIHIPNGMIFQNPIANYSRGFEYIWNELHVLVTFESDWRKAKKILTKIADSHSENLSTAAEKKLQRAAKKYMIFYQKLTPIVYTSVKESGVMLSIRHLCEPRSRRGVTQEFWEDILTAFEKEKNINFAYPTQRFYNSSMEENS